MAEEIYTLKGDGLLEPMQEEKFLLEDALQQLIADHPELLSGQQINPADPRRWILIKREQGIADIQGSHHRWAVDHLLIDQDAIPTLVETKRSTNSEIRRTIVGQMLDYAAHAKHTWNAHDLREDFENSSDAARRDPDTVLAELLDSDDELETDKFWQQVETNLRAARLRLLFVSDEIPDELTRVVEFLNEQMPGIEVLAVEIKQFRGETGTTLVPRVIGRTADPSGRSSGPRGSSRRIKREEFLERMPSPDVLGVATRLFEVSEKRGASLVWGNAGVSIRRHTPAWRSLVTVAWLYPPEVNISLSGTFSFGAGNYYPNFFDSLPTNLRRVLENWADQFSDDAYTRDVSSTGFKAWSMTYGDAVGNIDVLVQRLDKVLSELETLQPLEDG